MAKQIRCLFLKTNATGSQISGQNVFLNHGKSKVLPKMPPGNMAVIVFKGHENHFLSLKKKILFGRQKIPLKRNVVSTPARRPLARL